MYMYVCIYTGLLLSLARRLLIFYEIVTWHDAHISSMEIYAQTYFYTQFSLGRHMRAASSQNAGEITRTYIKTDIQARTRTQGYAYTHISAHSRVHMV
jgi:hypothetical protein